MITLKSYLKTSPKQGGQVQIKKAVFYFYFEKSKKLLWKVWKVWKGLAA